MSKKRIVVTGLGVTSCFGTDVNHFFDSLIAGKCGIKIVDEFKENNFPTQIAAPVSDYSPEEFFKNPKDVKRADDCVKYGMVAGKKALENAGFNLQDLSSLKPEKCGIIIGSGMGGMQTFITGVETYHNKGFKRVSPFFIPYIITNMAGGLLAIDIGFQGPNYSVSTACATGNYSIHLAAEHIRRGETDLMLCGGVEAPLSPLGLSGFMSLQAVSKRNDAPEKSSRPWDKERDGFVMGEGAGVLVLESLEHAQARGATILAEYHGGAFSCDAYHMTSPREDGAGVAQCIESALKDAGINRERINYINAHATSTPVGDTCEINGLRKVFSDEHLHNNVKMNGTKSMIGHTLGAAGGLEAVVCVKSIVTGKLHPTLNLESPESCIQGIDVLADGAIEGYDIDVAMSNSFGFGGHNSALLFGKYKE